MSDVTFIGGGSFGTALAIMLAKKGYDIVIWDRNKDILDDINTLRSNTRYLPNSIIPCNVKASGDIEKATKESKYIVLAVPSFAIRDVCKKIKGSLKEDQIIVTIAKGMEEESKKRLSEVIKEELYKNPVVVLSGPSHAEEVANDIPTTVVVTSTDMKYAEQVQDVFMTNSFRVYTNSDIVGVEIGGAVKNIIALASGICDGIGYGDNTKAALMTRGMSEIMRIGIKLGGKPETFFGLTGMGDLIVTCTSMHSRNRKAGILIGRGMSCDEACKKIGMVVEGVKACHTFYELKNSLGVSMPITNSLYKVLFENAISKKEVSELMRRDKKYEYYF
ncbi:NAD(P)H-dependent glycerol-3-phosphate dehydrogenase [Clostridium felsineum]|uniref:NAD(P)H-dependent glycerol-3-phosphate dehydrogenase n=1 Tax=Clostridium felsineum TaxID=36839 RepID=UPI00098C76AB|nr:NAD(P)H-dependent glycerol-3-phosphate dehydrogenase [Clostridium felsineum]MCR3759293.1 NAD(P)H-dependent glycerol-3-phosphate dehydrogenase [Clostridium felsineum]URZ00824.1 Glycerol-3-phosphate dehydrogenase [NAD(P)+] [Clostridium felsineum]